MILMKEGKIVVHESKIVTTSDPAECSCCGSGNLCENCSSAQNSATALGYTAGTDVREPFFDRVFPWDQTIGEQPTYACQRQYVFTAGTSLSVLVGLDGRVWARAAYGSIAFGDNDSPNPLFSEYKDITDDITCVGGEYSGVFRLDHISATPSWYILVSF